MTGATGEDGLPPLTGSVLLDPWRIRLRLQREGLLSGPPPREPTESEIRLWRALSSGKAGWCREYATGPYRLDFYLPAAGLAVEVDGDSHRGRKAAERDAVRDEWHRLKGIRTLRVSDREVLRDLAGVLYLIDRELQVRELRVIAGVPSRVENEVAVLKRASAIVEAEIRRLGKLCKRNAGGPGLRRLLDLWPG